MAPTKKNGTLKSPTKAKGFKAIEAPTSAFWAPGDPKSGHPELLTCAYLGARTLPAHGKFQEQHVIDVACEDGAHYTIPLKGDLGRKVGTAALEEGQTIMIEWLGFEAPTDKRPMGMNRYALSIAL